MTTVNFVTVAESIAALSWQNGIHAKRPNEIPVNGITECPYFAPRPDNFITDISLTREAFGGSGTEPMNLVYTTHWTYCHAPIGTVLTFTDYGDMIANIATILETLADNDLVDGAVDIQVLGVPNIAQVFDAAGNAYHGAIISIRVLEFING